MTSRSNSWINHVSFIRADDHVPSNALDADHIHDILCVLLQDSWSAAPFEAPSTENDRAGKIKLLFIS